MFNAKTGAFALIALAALALVLIVAQSDREDSDAGQQAWDAGSVDEAVAQWRAAADEGDRRAMLSLGRLYAQGMGVLQDPVEAHKWFNLAASLGEAAALEERDALAVLMTPMELAEARQRAEVERERQERQQLVRKWPSGKKFRDCVECPELVVVPAGSFMMGSPESEEGLYDWEGPVHEVTIPKPFAVGIYEVTVGEFGHFVNESGHSQGEVECWIYKEDEWQEVSGNSWNKPGFSQTDAHPVVCVSWEDAREYVRWLSQKTGENYRLLSESEWEYVARAGTRTVRYWGESESGQCRHANGLDRSAKEEYSSAEDAADCDDGYVHTAPVGSFSANAFGLYDVHGNVWEWVGDCWNENYKGAPTDGSVWELGECEYRVLRGGSWDVNPRLLHSAGRVWNTTGYRDYGVGFRVARTLAP